MLVNCLTCGGEISEDADPCPHCGKSNAGFLARWERERQEAELKQRLAAQQKPKDQGKELLIRFGDV